MSKTAQIGDVVADMIRTVLVVVVTGFIFGVIMALVSSAFVQGVECLTNLRSGIDLLRFELAGLNVDISVFFGLFIAAALVLLVRRWFGITRWHGPADSIHAAHRTDNELDVKSGLGSTLAAFISAGGGASIGQYGPLVHFGATIGSLIRRKTGGILSTDIFIGCGVAGAISAGFDTPIAGIIFAHEAILRHFSLRAIAPIAIASITAAWVRDRIFDGAPLFLIDSSVADTGTLLPAALIAGPFFGLLAVTFMLAVRYSAALAKATQWSPPMLIAIATLIMGLIATFVPETLGFGMGAMQQMLDGAFSGGYLALILIAKLVATALCIGFGFFGGMFSPALFVGMAAGSLGARLVGSLGFAVAAPGMAICGMAAVGSAVIGAPIAGVLIILEMTMSYEFAMAAMLAVVTSNLVSHLIFGHSFFDRQLLDRGIDVSRGRGHLEMMEMPVSGILSADYISVRPDATVGDVIDIMVGKEPTNVSGSSYAEAYIIRADGEFIGKVSLTELLKKPKLGQASDHALYECISIKHDASLQQATEIASGFVGESIPVIDRDRNCLIGVVSEGDILQQYLRLHSRIRDLEQA